MSFTIPPSERKLIDGWIRAHPEYFSPPWLRAAYLRHAARVIPEADSPEFIRLVTEALRAGRPLSVIRLGDGEMNFLAHGAYPGIPQTELACARLSMAGQADRFKLDVDLLPGLREMMMEAVHEADLIGVLGLWRPTAPGPEDLLAIMDRNPRGYIGGWQGIDCVLRLARDGQFMAKTLVSAHCYLAVVRNIDTLVQAAESVLLVTSQARLAERLRVLYPGKTIDFSPVGAARSRAVSGPEFLAEFHESLPQRMSGRLCLIGAGPWAEHYCTRIRRRGGVAIDVGSGMDLLAGIRSRPMHRHMPDPAVLAL